jgi:hypothetical protein
MPLVRVGSGDYRTSLEFWGLHGNRGTSRLARTLEHNRNILSIIVSGIRPCNRRSALGIRRAGRHRPAPGASPSDRRLRGEQMGSPATAHSRSHRPPHGSARPHPRRHGAGPPNTEPRQRGPSGQEGAEHGDGTEAARAFPCFGRPAPPAAEESASSALSRAGGGLMRGSRHVLYASPMTKKLPKRGLPPMHPGELLREEFLPALDRPKGSSFGRRSMPRTAA